jgi:ribosomal protein S18 acetylase RimI-like enzyme
MMVPVVTGRVVDAGWVRAAHADAWEAHGRFRVDRGGGATRLPGIRLMASGLPHPQWNNGDVLDPAVVDIAEVARWYDEKRVPWGLRVPLGQRWPHGRHLFSKRLMGLVPEAFAPAVTAGVTLRAAGPHDVDAVLAVDTVAFEETVDVERPWVEPLLSQPSLTVGLAECEGKVVGCGHCLVTDGDAGRTVYVAGIGVLPGARNRGVGAALSSWLVERGLDSGAHLAHLHPDTDEAARIYARLGFVEVDGFDVYVDNA